MKLVQTALVGLAGVFFAATTNATTFYIDQFQITRDQDNKPGTIQPWFVDNFDDGIAPPSSEGTFPNGTTGSYLTVPDPMPGPEENGKLRLDTAQGFARFGSVSGDPILIQRARLATNTSNEVGDLYRGLKDTQVFEVTGTFDLIEPTIDLEYYGVRLTDFSGPSPNDNVELRVIRTASGEWEVQFVKADFDLGVFNIIDSVLLSDITGVGDYEQIALTLTKSSGNDKLISAAFELIDLGGANSLQISLDGTAGIFDGERWTQAAFFAIVPRTVPIPATLFLMGLGMLGFRCQRLKQTKLA